MNIAVLGIDLGKNVCSVVGLDDGGRVLVRRRLKRPAVVEFARQSPGCVVAMEACCGAHHLGRQLAAQGHEVRLMSPEYVRPYVKAQKNDDRDAEAIAEASLRPTMRFVPVKSELQSDLQSLHRARERLIAERTALINHLRAVLFERGIIVAQGRRKLEKALPGILADAASSMSPRIRQLISDLRGMAYARRSDHQLRCRACVFGADRRSGPAVGNRARYRHDQRDGAGGSSGRW
jgi:transposase